MKQTWDLKPTKGTSHLWTMAVLSARWKKSSCNWIWPPVENKSSSHVKCEVVMYSSVGLSETSGLHAFSKSLGIKNETFFIPSCAQSLSQRRRDKAKTWLLTRAQKGPVCGNIMYEAKRMERGLTSPWGVQNCCVKQVCLALKDLRWEVCVSSTTGSQRKEIPWGECNDQIWIL